MRRASTPRTRSAFERPGPSPSITPSLAARDAQNGAPSHRPGAAFASVANAFRTGGRWMSPAISRYLTADQSPPPGFSPYPAFGNTTANWKDATHETTWKERLTDIGVGAAMLVYQTPGFIAGLPGAMWDGIQQDVKGYQKAGFSSFGSVFWGVVNNLPVLSAGVRLAEAYEGRSLAGATYGKEMDWAERYQAVSLAALEVLPFGRAAGATWSAAKAAGRAVPRAASMAARGATLAAGLATRSVVRQGVATTVRAAVGTAAHAAAQPFVKAGVHGVVGRVAGRETYTAAKEWARRNGFKACFDAGSPIPLKDGCKPIEEVKDYETYGDDCDWVVSRNEHDPDGPLVFRRVLRKFTRESLVMDVFVQGRRFGTTFEHPFFPKHRNEWTAAGELTVGDELRLMAPGWLPIEKIADTGEVRTVYNLEVEDDHTYFVGCDEWGFSVWAHNATAYDVYEQGSGGFSVRYRGEATGWNTKWAADADGSITRFATEAEANAWAANHANKSTVQATAQAGLTASEIELLGKQYAGFQNSNKTDFKWSDMNRPLTPDQKSAVRNYARDAGLIDGYDAVKWYGTGNLNADFSAVAWKFKLANGFEAVTVDLPVAAMKSRDRGVHFTALDNEFFGGAGNKPVGWTWHHMAESGKMQLVPTGVHRVAQPHNGLAEWAPPV